MSNSRSIRRSIARHPVNVWRAKKKAKDQWDAAVTAAEEQKKKTAAKLAALVEKWEKTGLLDGKISDSSSLNMAVLIESQEKQVITEATKE